jgi:hypothetical protein
MANQKPQSKLRLSNGQSEAAIEAKKDRQHNGNKKKDKRTNSDLQNNVQNIKDRAKQTPTNRVGALM